MENPMEVASEEAEAAAATDATLAITPTRPASEEMEPAAETSHQGDLTKQDDDFGDFAAATPSDVVDAKDEQTDLESDLHQNKNEEINDTKDEDFGEFESTSEKNGSHVVDGSDRPQVSPPDDLDDPFAHLPTAATSKDGGVGEEVPNDETAVVNNTVLCDLVQKECSTEDNAVQFPVHSSEDSETESKNGIVSDNGHVEAFHESEDFGEFETPQENTIIPLVDSEERKVAPVDAFDDPFAHLSTGEEISCVSHNTEDTEQGNAIISDSPRKVSPNDDDEFFSTHPTNDNSENGASESDGVESETGHESSSPDNDAGYFSAVTDGDGGEQSNEEGIPMNEPSMSAETMVQESNSTEEMTVNDSDHSGTENNVGTTSIIEQPGAETSSSLDIDATIEITEHSEGDHIDSAVVKSDGFGAFERVAENIETQADSTEISDDIATEGEVAEESGSPGLSKESAVVEEMVATEKSVDDDDFGDLGSFEKADNAPAEAANDLEALDTAPPEDEPIGDDDFGDFGSFEHAEATTSDEQGEAPQVQQNDEDEDFGDFGDFTDFSSDAPAQQENSVNVSGAAVRSDENTGHPPAQPPATNLLDPIVNKAEIIFKEVFARENIPSEDGQHAPERVVVKVISSLTELGAANVSEDPSTWLIESISSVMRGVEHLDKSGPTAIVNESSDYPYGHFTVPVCGLPLTKVDISASRRLRQKKAQDGIAFTESQDYSVGASFSADTTEPSVEPSPVQQQVAQQSAGTVVNLPPLKSDADTVSQNGSGPVDASFADLQSSNDASQSSRSSHASGIESNGKKETLSSSAKQFLQQIPDLSFMLKPTLSLPKKS